MCNGVGLIGTPELKARNHDPAKNGWTMVVAVGEHVLGTGVNPRRGAAGENALTAAIEHLAALAIQRKRRLASVADQAAIPPQVASYSLTPRARTPCFFNLHGTSRRFWLAARPQCATVLGACAG